MRNQLITENLWDKNDPSDPASNISAAWQVLSRTGAACRFIGMSPDGQREILLLDPRSGHPLASGRGRSTPEAMCRAALAAGQARRNAEQAKIRAA